MALFTDKIIAVSDNVRRDLLALGIGTEKKVVTVPLGLELKRYLDIQRDAAKDKKDHTSIGIIGRLVPVKNHKMFFDTAKILLQASNAERKMKFVIVGDGPLRSELEDYVRDLGIKDDVTFTGWIKDLESVYRDLDIAVLTSLNEGTPVALIEAQAAACPCVATSVGGSSEVVEHGKSGLLVPSQDRQRLFQAIEELMFDPQKRQDMGRCGRDRVRHRFDKERLIDDIEELYEQELLKQGKDKR